MCALQKENLDRIRADFPALAQQFWGKQLVYLDNAATSQKPKSVLELLNRMNSLTNANVHRAMYTLSDRATELYEAARTAAASFINASERESVIFTSGTTASINLVASSFSRRYIGKGDKILITADSHHSNIVPWQLAASACGAEIVVLPIKDNGEWEMEALPALLCKEVKIVAATHISNVLGIVNPVEDLIEAAHSCNIPVLLDGAQGIVHQKVDVKALDCDFYAFSAHKIYGETGSGVLYGKRKWLEEMPPYMGGGDMVGTVTFQKTTYAPLPLKFEAGTPNFIANAALAPALEYASLLRKGEMGRDVAESERAIVEYLLEALPKINGVRLYGIPAEISRKIPLFSINVQGCNSGDIAQILDKLGIAARSGMMCAEPVMSRYGITGMLRASFAPYNTLQEAELYVEGLKRALAMLL